MRTRILYTLLILLPFFFPGQAVAASVGKVEVFVAIPPQKWICEQIGHGLLNTHVLVDKGQEPHVFEARPRQILALSRASFFFGIGMEFEQVIRGRLEQTAPHLHIVDTALAVERIPMQGRRHDHGGEEKGDAGHDGIELGFDPHVWLSPANLKVMAASMVEALAAGDPGHRQEYETNLAVLNRKLDTLDQTIGEKLAPFHGASFFVFHPSFGYFAHRYHLQQEAVETGGKSPTPRQLSVLIQRARTKGVRVIFVQPQFDPKSAAAVAAAIGGTVVPLDPLAEDVEANLYSMADRITQALKSQEAK